MAFVNCVSCKFSKNMKIIGIDPGYGRVGWGVIEGQKDTWTHIAHGCIETNQKATLAKRICEIHAALQELITTHEPDMMGIEKLFFKKNVTTGLQVAHARGIMLFVAETAGIPIVEVAPVEVKQAVTGYGNADKAQVQQLVAMMLKLPKKRFQDDAADALAVAFTASVYGRLNNLDR